MELKVVAYVHTHRVTEIVINKTLPRFGDTVAVHQAFKKPPPFENRGVTGVCLGHDSRVAGGVLVVSVVNSDLKEFLCFPSNLARHGIGIPLPFASRLLIWSSNCTHMNDSSLPCS